MSKFLYKLGKSAYSRPWLFIGGWVVVLAIVIAMLSVNGVSVSSEMKLEGTESQKVLDQLAEVQPEASGGQGSVVFVAPEGESLNTPERLAAIKEAVDEVYGLDQVLNAPELAAQAMAQAQAQAQAAQGAAGGEAGAGDAAAGAAGQGAGAGQSGEADAQQGAGMAQQEGAGAAQQGADAGADAAARQGAAGSADQPPYTQLIVDGAPVIGVTIANDGRAALFQFQFTVQQSAVSDEIKASVVDTVESAASETGLEALPSESLLPLDIPIGSNEVYGLVVAAIVLIMTLGSVIAAGLPLVVALFGVGIGVGGAYAFSTYLNMSSITPVLALMVGLAVGIDYALFIINRQRRLIFDQGLGAKEAASRSIGTAGSAVFFAGLTVIIALCGLLVIGIGFLSTMALVASATVLLNVLIALTLLPALLGLIGERICSRKAREKNAAVQASRAQKQAKARWIHGVIKFRWPVILLIVVILGIAAVPAAQMNLAIPSAASADLDTAKRQSYDAISESFGEGFNGTLLIVAESANGENITPQTLGALTQGMQLLDNVSVVSPLGISENGKLAMFSVIPKTGPNDEATSKLVTTLRDENLAIATATGVTLGVTGVTAVNIDMSAKLAEVFPIYVGIIVVLSLIILLLVFRSIVVPIKATVGFLLSILATFGITTAVFQWGWAHDLFAFDTAGPILSFMPIMVTGILYGLAMDYQVFLVSSMRESYVHGHRGTESVIHGYGQASRVVVAAAVIMVAVFAGFIFTHDIMIKQIGFALAIGILIDAFVIRMTLVPAVMSLFGDKAWALPKWLDRILPNLDVEGDKLLEELKAQEAAEGARGR
ncbi:MMPL family transporter [Saccharibacillus alkalitolerans]|uniref:MMPL family transporter n=1 Tax=Saccharibacillus alkalitolerans TaxID=2705290 RepID=A0ABX0FA36_9BACL|nr:MMPL family transporter [Saccharibacillus alkalitolerans]NGZ77260.1 MMPL family transporter [Saccharibacillus alkalitolerans]